MAEQTRYRVRGVAVARTPAGLERALPEGTVIDGILEPVEPEANDGTASERTMVSTSGTVA